jgi:RNA polymerase sigma-70 factor (ECF subfamily)
VSELERLRRDLLAFARRRRGPDEAEDLVQEAFTRLHRAGHRIDGPDARPLLFTILRNLAVDAARSGRRAPTDAIEPHESRLSDPAPDAESALIARQTLEAVRLAIRDLPPRCRDAFLLNRFEQMTYPQIAARLGVSVSMVEKHLSEALRRLKVHRHG